MTKATSSTSPRIYVACLASYNAGKLHGEWIDATDPDEMSEAIKEMLTKSSEPNAEEYAIHDHEGFEGIEISEHEDLETVALHASQLTQHDGAWAAYVGNVGAKYATEDDFSDTYRGEYSSPEDYAEELISECYDLKSMGNLANYIDYEKFARDLEFDGYAFIPGGNGVYVFSPS